MAVHYIGADVHRNNAELGIERDGRIIARHALPMSVRAIRQVLDELPGVKHLTFEEGPLAGWLYRNLKDHVDTLVVCDPRRNKLIACDGDKDDRIDAAKFAALLRGGYLREVYHSVDPQRVALKRWVALYHDQVKDATRAINKIRGCCRLYGQRVPRRVLREASLRAAWLTSLEPDLVEQVQLLWMGYEIKGHQVRQARAQLVRRARAYPIIAHWSALPGVGLIRATTLFAYLDTPWRFKKKTKLWKYCGVGLQRASSGQDRFGRVPSARLRLAWAVNRQLKNVIVGAALSAIRSGDNVFRRHYERRIQQGAVARNARHAVARKMLTVMWGMWKNPRPFDAGLG
jgi:transposase